MVPFTAFQFAEYSMLVSVVVKLIIFVMMTFDSADVDAFACCRL
jgi:hypothetical protein